MVRTMSIEATTSTSATAISPTASTRRTRRPWSELLLRALPSARQGLSIVSGSDAATPQNRATTIAAAAPNA